MKSVIGAAAGAAVPMSAVASSVIPPREVMSLTDEVVNVWRGYSASGQPASHGAIAVPLDMDAVKRAEQAVLGVFNLTTLDGSKDHVRTQLIRKALEYVRSASCSRDELRAATWAYYLHRHPEALDSPLSLSDFRHLQLRHIAREEVRKMSMLRERIESMRARLNPPPWTLVWEATDGTEQMVKLTNEFHAWEAGQLELAMWFAEAHLKYYATGATIPYDRHTFFGSMLRTSRIYAFRRKGRFYSLATLIHSPTRTLLAFRPPWDRKALTQAADALRITFGPDFFMSGAGFRNAFIEDRRSIAYLAWGPDPLTHAPWDLPNGANLT